jgi:hypothetical protein
MIMSGSLRKRVVVFLALTVIGAAIAAPPIEPLPSPFYSFDRVSPTVQAGIVGAADVLRVVGEEPTVFLPGDALGLGAPGDELDCIAVNSATLPPTATFLLLFSVTRETEGVAQPDPQFVDLGIPYNVLDQFNRGHSAGDQFASADVFERVDGFFARGTRPPTSNNSNLTRNNFDEGGTDFAAMPATHARDDLSSSGPLRVPQDNVDATARAEPPFPGGLFPYYSASCDSPSLPTLPPGDPSGSNIYAYNGTNFGLYASYFQLGLLPEDDVDGIVVFDFAPVGSFGPPDFMLFSLRFGSPSLATIDGHSDVGAAADVYIVSAGSPPTIFVPASALGLGAFFDDIDALDVQLCSDGLDCNTFFGIRYVRGDYDDDGDVDIVDFRELQLGGPDVGPVPTEFLPFDFDGDEDVDLRDVGGFQRAFTGTL